MSDMDVDADDLAEFREAPSTLTKDWASCFRPHGWLGEYLDWACKTTHAPPLFHLLAGLSYTAFELARRGWKMEGFGFEQTAPALWIAMLAESGTGKSAALRRIQKFDTLVRERTPVLIRDERVTPPLTSSLVTIRGSYQGVFTEMEKRIYPDLEGGERTCCLLLNDEFQVVLEMAKKSPEFSSHFLELSEQVDMVFHQRGIQKDEEGRTGILPRPAISTLFVSTTEQLSDTFNVRLLHGGFSSRFLWFYPREWIFWPDPPSSFLPKLKLVAAKYVQWLEKIANRDSKHAKIFMAKDKSSPVKQMHSNWSTYLHEKHPIGSPHRVLYVPRMAEHTALLAALISAAQFEGRHTEPVFVDQRAYEIAKNITYEAYNSMPVLISMARVQETKKDDELQAYARIAGRKGITAVMVSKLVDKPLAQVYHTLRAAVEMENLVKLSVKTGRPGKPATYYFHPECAPPPELRVQVGPGEEGITGARYTLWASDHSVENILHKCP